MRCPDHGAGGGGGEAARVGDDVVDGVGGGYDRRGVGGDGGGLAPLAGR